MRLLLLILVVFTTPVIVKAQLSITNTTIVDVENKKLITNQDVLVQEGKIVAVGTGIKARDGTKTIDGKGKYLMPGLVDAHVHFSQSGGIYTRPDAVDLRKYKSYDEEIKWTHENLESFLRRYTSAGITSVVDVGSTINFLKQRDTFRTKSYAPTVYMTGPLLTTWEPDVYKGLKDDEPFYEMTTVDEARSYVQKQLPYKPDFIKIWYIIQGQNKDSAAKQKLPLVQAVIAEAHRNGLRVAVHATERITAQLAVQAGANLLVHGIDDEPIDEAFVQLLKKHNVVLTPTLVVAGGYSTAFGQTYTLTADDYHYAHPTPLNSLIDFKHLPDTALLTLYKTYFRNNALKERSTDSLLMANLKRLANGGVTIATGTDAGNIGTQHASSYFRELAAMRQSGMNLWQIIQSSTINGARAVGKDTEFGSIKKGKRADMILLNRNPLDSLQSWKSIDWVINKGVAMKPDSVLKPSALEVVDKQALAFNAHDVDFYMETIADSIQMYMLPAHYLDLKGRDSVRKAYTFLNNSPDLYCRILKRIVERNMIIDHEEVYFQGEKKPYHGIAIYYVSNGKIEKVFFY
jgi:imidazolonepropionase-like amidohydrolase